MGQRNRDVNGACARRSMHRSFDDGDDGSSDCERSPGATSRGAWEGEGNTVYEGLLGCLASSALPALDLVVSCSACIDQASRLEVGLASLKALQARVEEAVRSVDAMARNLSRPSWVPVVTPDYESNNESDESDLEKFEDESLVEEEEEEEEEDGDLVAESPYRFMISPRSRARVAWDLLLSLLLIYLVVVDPIAIGFWDDAQSSPGFDAFNLCIDVAFCVDLVSNFRTGYYDDDNVEVMNPELCARNYVKTWFPVDVASSVPALLAHILKLAASSGADSVSKLQLAKALKLVRLSRPFRLARVSKLARLSPPVANYVEDLIAEVSPFWMTFAGIIAAALVYSHLLACVMGFSGNRWYQTFACTSQERWGSVKCSNPSDFSWQHAYGVAFYAAFMTTLGMTELLPRSPGQRTLAMVVAAAGTAVTSFIIATFTSMVSAADAKGAILKDRMDQLSSWMRHYRFEPTLRRRVRAFFRRFYAIHTAIDERIILENLDPELQHEVSTYLLHDFVQQHPLFVDLPSGLLWRVLVVVRTIHVDAGVAVVTRNKPGLGLYIMLAGKAKAEYLRQQGRFMKRSQSLPDVGSGALVHAVTQKPPPPPPPPPKVHRRKEQTMTSVVGTATISSGASFGELCLLGKRVTSLVTVTTTLTSEFFLIQRSAFLDAFANVPEVLESITAASDQFEGHPIMQIERGDMHRLSVEIPTERGPPSGGGGGGGHV
ncbi:hypothetical protein CTAYLR_002702 [Chrysophaeum taylorii]|uniref:Cyclic nucleotide-binding domain-containing protein n=1 Tax=Chrysophaeum taylorii TaxID=2483200 RepID=A0AAD7UC70_9STRA|nr:hypothetical protein CTAYLR_002702 [Chrysophaeum taylorii]